MTLAVYVAENYKRMSDIAAGTLIGELRRLTKVNLALATGHSTQTLYNIIARNPDKFDASKMRISNIDELILPRHLQESKSYASSLRSAFSGLNLGGMNLLDTSGINPGQLEGQLEGATTDFERKGMNESGRGIAYLIKGTPKSETLRQVKSKMEAYRDYILRYGGFDWAILGVGENDHIGLHEKGIPFECRDVFLVKLDETTVRNLVNDGYFSPQDAPKYGITLNAKFIANNSRNVMVLASGGRKSNAITDGLLGDIDDKKPLSILREYAVRYRRKIIFVVDKEAADGILAQERKLREKNIKVIFKY